MRIYENESIAPYTTINLGGKARFFCICDNEDELKKCIDFAKENNYSFKVISGGSNVVFPDDGYNGLIIQLSGEKISVIEDSDLNQTIEVWAGTKLDDFIKWSIENSLSGIECLSGIPGSIGATPIQNVGAYGQQIGEVIKSVIAYDFNNNSYINFKNDECKFNYRTSIFKKNYKNNLIITKILIELSKRDIDNYSYKDLIKEIEKCNGYNNLRRKEKLNFIRNTICKIRKNKSMIYDKSDPDSISCGSFFLNPHLNESEFKKFYKLAKEKNLDPPYLKDNSGYKISAAYLIENSGFHKGYIKNGAGISKKHSLALVNYGCDTKTLLKLAEEIRINVKNNFGITLDIEPDIINM